MRSTTLTPHTVFIRICDYSRHFFKVLQVLTFISKANILLSHGTHKTECTKECSIDLTCLPSPGGCSRRTQWIQQGLKGMQLGIQSIPCAAVCQRGWCFALASCNSLCLNTSVKKDCTTAEAVDLEVRSTGFSELMLRKEKEAAPSTRQSYSRGQAEAHSLSSTLRSPSQCHHHTSMTDLIRTYWFCLGVLICTLSFITCFKNFHVFHICRFVYRLFSMK